MNTSYLIAIATLAVMVYVRTVQLDNAINERDAARAELRGRDHSDALNGRSIVDLMARNVALDQDLRRERKRYEVVMLPMPKGVK